MSEHFHVLSCCLNIQDKGAGAMALLVKALAAKCNDLG